MYVEDQGDDGFGYVYLGRHQAKPFRPLEALRRFFYPEPTSLDLCVQIVPDFDLIEDAAVYAHTGYETAAHATRVSAGYAHIS